VQNTQQATEQKKVEAEAKAEIKASETNNDFKNFLFGGK
jgi:hypothetical protein